MTARKIQLLAVMISGLFLAGGLMGQPSSPSPKGSATPPNTKHDFLKQMGEEMHFAAKPKPTNAVQTMAFYTDASNFHSNQAVKLALQLSAAADFYLKESLKYRYSEESMRWKTDLDILNLAREWSAKPTASNYFAGLIRTAQNKLTQDIAAPRVAQAKLERERKAALQQAEAQRKREAERDEMQRTIKRDKLCRNLFEACGDFFAFPFPFFLACSGLWVTLLRQKKHLGAQLVLNGLGVVAITACIALDVLHNGLLTFNPPPPSIGEVSFLSGLVAFFLALHVWAYLDKPRRKDIPVSSWRRAVCILFSGVTVAWLLLVVTDPAKSGQVVQRLLAVLFMAAKGGMHF